jgi:hypothetical protein
MVYPVGEWAGGMVSRMMSDHEVQTIGDSMSEFNVKFHGPKESNSPPPAPLVSSRCIHPFTHC